MTEFKELSNEIMLCVNVLKYLVVSKISVCSLTLKFFITNSDYLKAGVPVVACVKILISREL